ncbi:FAST kinase domain-containing protein 2, mitochondrial [Anarrhichthys ocellatus]|uniref:FAST kinase domain-containing protein 2, mitochondrial n=1 Tax=Anarrhichthys ocellatus TaxID=433405 RepID=UPI0012ECFC5D|nr:FAST kinase domain-containing protein 2, mitochondrial [Anarrhichthys ocellatus]XP_031707665.1 FAST kinase domain-containing protein 2, mitochondrial [Anarrhichthys ocellatus]
MAVRVTEEVVRWSLRYCSRRSPVQLRSFLLTTSIKDRSFPSQQFAHIWGTRQSQTCLDRSPVSSVRFYSWGGIHSQDLEEKEHLSSRLGQSSLPAEIQSDERSTAFSDHLRHCGSPSDVLDLTSQYSPTVRQVSNCLTHMWSTTKKMSDEQRRYELQLMFEHPEFDKLLQKAMKRVGHMRSDDLAYSLLGMVKLGVPQGSRVVQTFLRTCQENLNDFDEKGLSILASCLEHMEGNANVGALKEGMRLVVEARLPRIKNVMALQTMMRLLGKDAPLDLKRKLERKALSMTDQFSLPNTQYMISTMATMGFYSKPLLDVCSKTIKENLNGIPFNRLYKVLQSCRELHYRDLDLLTGISEYIASIIDIWTKKQVVLFLSVFDNLAFCPAALMEAFAKKVIANPDALTLKDLLCVLKVYSSLNYDLQHQRQQFLESLSGALDSYLPKMSGFELLKAVYHLCLLGHFPSAPLEQLLQSISLEKFSTTAPRFLPNQERMFQTVNLCLGLERPPLPQPLTVPPSVLGDPVPSSPPVNPWLSQGLRSVLGDQADSMLQEMVVVENFYLIDAVITKPLLNQTSVTEAGSRAGEECPPAESSQRIAVICTPHSGFCHGTSNPRGPLAVKIRHLKILGYNPVLVTEQELQSEEQRTDFLRGRIYPEHLSSDTQPEGDHRGS